MMATTTLSRREVLQKKTAALTNNFQEQLPKEFLFSLEGILQEIIIDSNELDSAKAERSEIRELIIEMRNGFRRMDERFEQMDQRFEAMQQQMDKRFEQVDKRFEQVTKRIDRFMIWSFGITFSATALIIAAMRYWR